MTKQEVLKRIGEIDKSLKETRGSKQHLINILERQGLYVILDYLEWREKDGRSYK